jgi:hypothetical protein
MGNTVITAPTPPYSNPPIRANFYAPSRFVISDITRGQTTLVTTTDDMNFVIGQQVRLLIPPAYGTYQLNDRQGYVVALPADNEVELAIDSTYMNDFVSASVSQQPQILPIGDVNTGVINNNGRTSISQTIPGSFINIS